MFFAAFLELAQLERGLSAWFALSEDRLKAMPVILTTEQEREVRNGSRPCKNVNAPNLIETSF